MFFSILFRKHLRDVPCTRDTVDGSEIRRSLVEVGSLPHDLQDIFTPRWLFGISSINHSLNVIYVRRMKHKLHVVMRSLSFGLQKKEVRFNSIKSRWCLISNFHKNGPNATCSVLINHHLPGDFNFFYFHPYLGEMIQFDEHIFQVAWNHKLVTHEIFTIQASWCWTHQRDIPILTSIFFRWVETTNQHKFLPIPTRFFRWGCVPLVVNPPVAAVQTSKMPW